MDPSIKFKAKLFYPNLEEEDAISIMRIKDILKDTKAAIEFKCFNKTEVEIIKENLTEEELTRVRFSWLFNA